jgi:hypothetical protein
MPRARAIFATLLLAATVACQKPPPRTPSPPPVADPEPPPPPPKCEAVDEGCKAEATTRARIPGATLTIVPPTGWTYAQEAQVTVALSKSSALALHAVPDAKPKAAPSPETLALLLDRLGVRFPKRKGRIVWPKRKADQVLKVKELSVALFQLDGAERDGHKGPVLLFSARGGGAEPLLVGAGFVPEDDDSKADTAILSSIESLSQATDEAGDSRQ